MVFDPDNPPIPPDAILLPSGPIFVLRCNWHRDKRAGIPVRPWREVVDEHVAAYLAERKRVVQADTDAVKAKLE
jgi:hypothetical protein